MIDRTKTGQEMPAHGKAATRNIAGLMHDLTELAELQAKLTASDAGALWKGSKISLVLLVTAGVLALGSIPVMLAGIGFVFVERLQWPVWASLLGTAFVAGILPAIVLVLVGLKRLTRALAVFSRSSEELSKNIAWFKQTLRRQSQPHMEATYSEHV